MMSSPVAGIDPHQATFTIAVVDPNGVEIVHDTFDNTSAGYLAAIELASSHGVERIGVEGSASWGSHISVAVVAAGFDAREVPPQRVAASTSRTAPRQDRRRRRCGDSESAAG